MCLCMYCTRACVVYLHVCALCMRVTYVYARVHLNKKLGEGESGGLGGGIHVNG